MGSTLPRRGKGQEGPAFTKTFCILLPERDFVSLFVGRAQHRERCSIDIYWSFGIGQGVQGKELGNQTSRSDSSVDVTATMDGIFMFFRQKGCTID
jgi:hypothetical protein